MSLQSGRPAQDEFKLLCSRANVTCNSSAEDDHGWDFIVEYAPEGESHQPHDRVPDPKQALVQVKSTQGQPSSALSFCLRRLPLLFQALTLGCIHAIRTYPLCYGGDVLTV